MPGDGGALTEASVPPPAGCDPTTDPKDAPLCVVDDYSVFVDASHGTDGDSTAGTRAAPFRTVTFALTNSPRSHASTSAKAHIPTA